ncbi:MAG: 16S rRNA (cytosine(1402)-N(4))-methyltransferase [Chlamydiae bacterium CG10_big_fil_rev_8_21_14_0_10_42_34]|nr:MAG: 16S rRNA (cytosine(1402)-N(4))-methyltransferase [Chlamydiae bacterium CG10_big_fil_rev_8_21_14_0_10_42_34]
MKHVPVLMREVLEVFAGKKLRTFFDGTLGAAGHANAILQAHPEIEKYIGCDRDPRAHELSSGVLAPWKEKVKFVRGSYAEMIRLVDGCIDGFLIDVGVSSMQLDERERGFSFMGDAPLDMRMDPEGKLTAEIIVNRYSEADLAKIFYEYGEERRSRQVAKAIVEARRKKRIRTTAELVHIIKPVATKGRLHPATLVFQALRIAVNDELGQLEKGIDGAIEKLCPGGRIAVISFHSLEDRIVKNHFRDAKDKVKVLTKKPIGPSAEEIRENPRSRSSKLRAAEAL